MSRNSRSKAKVWMEGVVKEGKKTGRTINFPTLNLHDPLVMKNRKQGVYACFVNIRSRHYHGALYYGPRIVLGEKQTILEIYVFNFSDDVYGEKVRFSLGSYIRGVLKFSSLRDLQLQLQKDTEDIKKALPTFQDLPPLIQ